MLRQLCFSRNLELTSQTRSKTHLPSPHLKLALNPFCLTWSTNTRHDCLLSIWWLPVPQIQSWQETNWLTHHATESSITIGCTMQIVHLAGSKKWVFVLCLKLTNVFAALTDWHIQQRSIGSVHGRVIDSLITHSISRYRTHRAVTRISMSQWVGWMLGGHFAAILRHACASVHAVHLSRSSLFAYHCPASIFLFFFIALYSIGSL